MNHNGPQNTPFELFGFQLSLGGQFLTPSVKPYKFTSFRFTWLPNIVWMFAINR